MAKLILFICTENSARSQMAEGFFNHHINKAKNTDNKTKKARKIKKYIAISAGTNPSSGVKVNAIIVMKEKNIDISKNKPKMLTMEMTDNAYKIFTMGCIKGCAVTPANKTIDWNLEDPAGKPIEKFREIRDEIEKRVKKLIDELE
ncbi:TPA: arsenate reductase ArsC [Candidatus Woesearchaeota archaeon]|nr:arsenate reductase ArsC [Candidatus Woesearchaeota archaeon]